MKITGKNKNGSVVITHHYVPERKEQFTYVVMGAYHGYSAVGMTIDEIKREAVRVLGPLEWMKEE